jgi:hypothetical protein
VNREHQQAERRMNDIAGTFASAIEEAVSGKADWNRVRHQILKMLFL